MKAFFSFIGIAILALVVLFGIQLLGLANFSFFAPRYQNVRREVFENTQSYTEGKRQEMAKYRLEYTRAKDPSEKEAIATMLRASFANVDKAKLEYSDRVFLESL